MVVVSQKRGNNCKTKTTILQKHVLNFNNTIFITTSSLSSNSFAEFVNVHLPP